MVKSNISLKNIIYDEDPSIESIDKSNELSQYSIPLFDYPDKTIAMGTKCVTYEKKGIIYHWCYLITNTNGVKIGVFEFPSQRYDSFLDEDNEVMTSHLLPYLLLFKNARQAVLDSEYQLNAGKTLGSLDYYKQASLALPHPDSAPFTLDMVKPDIVLSQVSSQDDYLGIKGIQIQPELGLIECLAKCLHNYLKQSEQQTTKYLYGILSDHITISMFEILKIMHDSIQDKLLENKEHHKVIKTELGEHKKAIKHSQNQDVEFQNSMDAIKSLKQQSQYQLSKHKSLQSFLSGTEHMKYIDTLEEFKNFIKSGKYVCEPWTIDILERLMNIKIILLSKTMPEWIVCSRQSPFPHNNSLFNPKYYVILEFSGNQYRIVEYNGISLLTFELLPLKIKDLIMNRCLEQNEGVYGNIPLFVKYQQFKLTGDQRKQLANIEIDLNPEQDRLIIGDTLKQFIQPGSFYLDRMDFDNVLDSRLVGDKQWREKLADNYSKLDGHFTLGEKDWASVNHYVTAQRLKDIDPSKYEKMSLTSGSSLAKKSIPYMVLDNDDRYGAVFAKFSQNPGLKQLLLDTGDASLYMYIPGKPQISLDTLEKVRQVLKTNTL